MTLEEAEAKIDKLEDQIIDLSSCVDDLIQVIEDLLPNRDAISRDLSKIRNSMPNC
jgi:hypothetical protein